MERSGPVSRKRYHLEHRQEPEHEMGTSKTRQLGVFMTAIDEAAFFRALQARLPAIRCIDVSQQTHSATPRYQTDIAECAGRLVTFVDSNLISESTFHARYVVRH